MSCKKCREISALYLLNVTAEGISILVRVILRDASCRPISSLHLQPPSLAVCIIFFSLSTIVSGSLQAQRKEEGSLPRRQPRRKAKFRWMRAVYCQSYSEKKREREREIEPPIHKNINSFAAAIRDKIYYQPAGRRPGRIPS
jgi:hypothetical protein